VKKLRTKGEMMFFTIGSGFFVCFETGSHYAAQADLKLEILLPQPPECWDYRCAPPHFARVGSYSW
jgi:hypothetical protein